MDTLHSLHHRVARSRVLTSLGANYHRLPTPIDLIRMASGLPQVVTLTNLQPFLNPILRSTLVLHAFGCPTGYLH